MQSFMLGKFDAALIISRTLDATMNTRHRHHIWLVEVLHAFAMLLLVELNYEFERFPVSINWELDAAPCLW